MLTRRVQALCAAVGFAMMAAGLAGCGHSIFTSGAPTPPLPTGPQFLYVTNNADSLLSEYSAATNGVLSFIGQAVVVTPDGKPAGGATGIAGTPGGAHLYVTNAQTGQIYGYSINAVTGVLTATAQAIVDLPAGAQPVAMVIDDAGDFLYVADEALDQVYQFSIDHTSGALTALVPASVTTAPGAPPQPKQSPVSITYSSSGSSVVVANSQAGTLVSFSQNTSTGLLKQVETVASTATAPGSPIWEVADNSVLYSADNAVAGGEINVFPLSGANFGTIKGPFTTRNPFNTILGLAVNPFYPIVNSANGINDNTTLYTISPQGLTGPTLQNGFNSLGFVTYDNTGALFYGLNTAQGLVYEGTIDPATFAVDPAGNGAIDTEQPANINSIPTQGVVVETPNS
jgi:hypothetical protein